MGTAFKSIGYKPASLDLVPSHDKYYGVGHDNYQTGNLRDRAVLVGIGNYPKPKKWMVVNMHGVTQGNTWDTFDTLPEMKLTLTEAIMFIREKGFNVYEFPDNQSLFQWLGESRS